MAPDIRITARSGPRQRLILRMGAFALTSFVIALASGAILPNVFSDARAAAVASLSLWAVIPIMFGMLSTQKPRSWKAWGGATLLAAAGWASATGISAVYIDDVFVGPPGNVFAAVFLVTFLPMVLIVVLTGIVVRMTRLTNRMAQKRSAEAD